MYSTRPISASGQVPGPKPSEESRISIRQRHNRIGKKYRNKLNDKFEGLQAILVQVASLRMAGGGGGDSIGSSVDDDDDDDQDIDMAVVRSPEDKKLKSLKGKKPPLAEVDEEEDGEDEEEGFDCDEDEDEDIGLDAVPRTSRSGGGPGMRQPRRRTARKTNKAQLLAMARKTIMKYKAEQQNWEQVVRQLESN